MLVWEKDIERPNMKKVRISINKILIKKEKKVYNIFLWL